MYHHTGGGAFFFFISLTQMFTRFTYKLYFSMYIKTRQTQPFTRIYRNHEGRCPCLQKPKPRPRPRHHCARLLCVFPAGLWDVTLSFGRHCHPASASQLRSVLVWQWGGQGYTGGTREEVTSQRGSWKRCPEIQQRTAEEEGGHGEVSFVAPGLSNP